MCALQCKQLRDPRAIFRVLVLLVTLRGHAHGKCASAGIELPTRPHCHKQPCARGGGRAFYKVVIKVLRVMRVYRS